MKSRRNVLFALSAMISGCGGQEANLPSFRKKLIGNADARSGRMTLPSGDSTAAKFTPGVHTLPVQGGRDALLFVPAHTAHSLALVISLHGAGGNARHGLDLLRANAEANRFAILAPASHDSTWDVIAGGYGRDVQALDTLLRTCSDRLDIDPAQLAIGGFSDGASYALSVGLINGDIFRHVLAFSPGFIAPTTFRDKPRIFISHGLRDTVLPIDPCSRQIVQRLRKLNYPLEYQEFDGPHSIPEAIRKQAVDWWLGSASAA